MRMHDVKASLGAKATGRVKVLTDLAMASLGAKATDRVVLTDPVKVLTGHVVLIDREKNHVVIAIVPNPRRAVTATKRVAVDRRKNVCTPREMFFLARSVSEGDHQPTWARNEREAEAYKGSRWPRSS
jgi:hypothetical protein